MSRRLGTVIDISEKHEIEKMKEALIATQEGKKPKLPSKAVNTSKADKAESSALSKDKNWLNLFGLGQKNKNE